MKFKIGDIVRYVGRDDWLSKGLAGEVIGIRSPSFARQYVVRWDNKYGDVYDYFEGQLDFAEAVAIEEKQMGFKIGDRVVLISKRWGDHSTSPVWGGCCGNVVGTVDQLPVGDLECGVMWDNGRHNTYDFSDLRLYEPSGMAKAKARDEFFKAIEVARKEAANVSLKSDIDKQEVVDSWKQLASVMAGSQLEGLVAEVVKGLDDAEEEATDPSERYLEF